MKSRLVIHGSGAFGRIGGRIALLTLAAVGCILLINVTHPQQVIEARQNMQQQDQPVTASSSEGLYRGQPISQLWARNLPEQAWLPDPQCRHFVTKFARDNCLEVVRLASFPRSGNTWTRFMLETATGLYTSSGGPNYIKYVKGESLRRSDEEIWSHVKSQKRAELAHLGFIGETSLWTQGTTIAMKTHNFPEPWNATEAEIDGYNWATFAANTTRRAILVVRDPFKALISLNIYSKTQSVLNNDNDWQKLFQGDEWIDFAAYHANHWYKLNRQWVERTNMTHVVIYEHLTTNTMRELQGMLQFLDVQPDPDRMECVRRHLEGRAHNKKHDIVPNHTVYPLHLRGLVWSYIHQLNWVLKTRGYKPLPLDLYTFADEFRDIGL
ncbi:WSC domain-containing protein 1-like [Pollicipes pollicipes]|uniref:WSC domain-containing protein 1-like n=1 Tax=Pollicipes pollicipes TaxID=41117 RepID=UPI00188596F9|nr:WSC domain-containing protein 1-like [Pollicipes pollicipes]